MKNKTTELEKISDRNFEILEKFFQDVQSIIYSGGHTKYQVKRLHAANYWATYFMRLNVGLAQEYLQDK